MSDAIFNLIKDAKIPRFVRIQQCFEREAIATSNIAEAIVGAISASGLENTIKAGEKIAITAGSRGIANIALITRAVVDYVKSAGALPFIVPSMGSHGGGNAEGEIAVLASYGITEESCGCPIIFDREPDEVGMTQEGLKVYVDHHAMQSDGIIVVGRVKPHTLFRGPYESGLMKMMAVGLGKMKGAQSCHSAGLGKMSENVEIFGRIVLDKAPIRMGIAILENPFEETHSFVALNPEEIVEKEPELLEKAFLLMPKIMFNSCDILVVDKIGKNYSGDGMDPNITGTFASPYVSGGIDATFTAILDLSEESNGNGSGLGAAHVMTRRLMNKLDLDKTYPNAITATVLGAARIPMILESDRDAIKTCITASGCIGDRLAKIIRIPNSLHLSEIMISENFLDEAQKNPNIKVLGEPFELYFDANGNLF